MEAMGIYFDEWQFWTVAGAFGVLAFGLVYFYYYAVKYHRVNEKLQKKIAELEAKQNG